MLLILPDASRSASLAIRMSEPAPLIGLCADCAHSRRVTTRRGSVFWLCRRSEEDPRFAKYPSLPVLSCAGYVPGPEPERD